MSKQVEDAASKKKAAPGTDGTDESKLEEQVGGKLANIFGTSDENLEVDDELENDEDLEEEDEEDESEEDDHEEDDDDEDDRSEEDDEDEEDDSSTSGDEEDELEPVPQAYIQAAKAYGWTDKKIKKLLKLDRATALETLAGIYDTRNQINSHYSEMGRRANQEPPKKKEPAPTVPPIDVAAIEEALGGKDEAAPVIALLQKQNEMIAAMQPSNEPAPRNDALLPDIDSRYQNAVEESGVEQQLNMFFDTDSMKPFKEVYGNMAIGQTWEDLPAGQRKHRFKVLQKADSIIGGAKIQGRKVSLQEALLDAHLLVTQPYRDKITVDGIRKKVVKRSKGRTLKPSKSRNKAKTGERMKNGKRTEAQLLQDTQARLNKIYR